MDTNARGNNKLNFKVTVPVYGKGGREVAETDEQLQILTKNVKKENDEAKPIEPKQKSELQNVPNPTIGLRVQSKMV